MKEGCRFLAVLFFYNTKLYMNEITIDEISQKEKGNHLKKLVLTANNIYGEENVSCYDYDDNSLIIVRYGDVVLTNKYNKSHLMRGVYAGFFITNSDQMHLHTMFSRSIYTFNEVISNFCFSHVSTHYIRQLFNSPKPYFSNVCEGYGDFPETKMIFGSKVTESNDLLDDIEYEILWHSLFNYISYESLEGGPYVGMSLIRDAKNIFLEKNKYIVNNDYFTKTFLDKIKKSLFSEKDNVYLEIYDLLKTDIMITPLRLKIPENSRVKQKLNDFFIDKHKKGICYDDITLYRKCDTSAKLYPIGQSESLSEYNEKLSYYKEKASQLSFPFKGKEVVFEVIGDNVFEEEKEIDYTNTTISNMAYKAILYLLNKKINISYGKTRRKEEDTGWYSTRRYEKKSYTEYNIRSDGENRIST